MAKLTFSLQTSMNHFIVIFYFRRLFMSNPKLLLIAWELDLNAVSSSLGDKIVWRQRCKNPVILSLPFPPLVLQPPPPPILPLSPPPRLLSNLTNYTAVTVWIAVATPLWTEKRLKWNACAGRISQPETWRSLHELYMKMKDYQFSICFLNTRWAWETRHTL